MTKAIIFDMDGIIIDSIPLHYKAWKISLKEYGVDLSFKEFNKLNGRKAHDTWEYRKKQYGLKDLEIDSAAKKKVALSNKLLKEEVKLFGDVVDLLKMIRSNGFKIAIATSSYKTTVDMVTHKFGLEKYFDAYVTADEVKLSKPDPAGYLLAANKLNVEPSECVVIEDAILGVDAAKNAGMRCIAVTTSFSEDKLNKADVVVNRLKEITLEMLN